MFLKSKCMSFLHYYKAHFLTVFLYTCCLLISWYLSKGPSRGLLQQYSVLFFPANLWLITIFPHNPFSFPINISFNTCATRPICSSEPMFDFAAFQHVTPSTGMESCYIAACFMGSERIYWLTNPINMPHHVVSGNLNSGALFNSQTVSTVEKTSPLVSIQYYCE